MLATYQKKKKKKKKKHKPQTAARHMLVKHTYDPDLAHRQIGL